MNSQVPEGYKQTEVGVIPDDWTISTLSEHASFQTGPFGSLLHKSDYIVGGVPLINPMHINNGKIEPTISMSVTEDVAKKLSSFHLHSGDIVIGRRGEMGRCAYVHTNEEGWLCGSGSMIIKVFSGTDARFIQRVLSSPATVDAVESASVGTTMINLNQKSLSGLKIAIPSTEIEQCVIASTLSDIDNLLASLDQLIAKKRDLKQATMQQLLTGKKRLLGFGEGEHYQETEIGITPEDWQVVTLGSCLVSSPDYGINAPAVSYSDRLPTYIRITDISEDGRFVREHPVSIDSENSENYFLSDGDIVFARTGASVGKSYQYDIQDGSLVFAGFLIRVRPEPTKLLASFIAAYVTSETYWRWVRLMSMRSGQPGINGREYSLLPVPRPSLPEQKAIIQILTDIDTEITTLQTRRNKTQALKQAMMQQLLTGKTRLVTHQTATK